MGNIDLHYLVVSRPRGTQNLVLSEYFGIERPQGSMYPRIEYRDLGNSNCSTDFSGVGSHRFPRTCTSNRLENLIALEEVQYVSN